MGCGEEGFVDLERRVVREPALELSANEWSGEPEPEVKLELAPVAANAHGAAPLIVVAHPVEGFRKLFDHLFDGGFSVTRRGGVEIFRKVGGVDVKAEP